MGKQLESVLLRELRNRDRLQLKEGNEDAFDRLTQELGNASLVRNPYQANKEQLK